jgi:precorrin-6B methylase 2
VLEVGSGSSTLWWLGRGNSVVAIETSKEWADSVRTSAGGNTRLELIVHPLTELDNFSSIPPDRLFDVLHIDHTGDRSEAIRRFLPHVDENGLVIVDNSDCEEYGDAILELADHGYSRLDLFGIGPINAYCWQTSLFYRGGAIRFNGRSQDFATIKY